MMQTHPLAAWMSAPMLFALGWMRGMEQRERKSAEIIILAQWKRAHGRPA